MATGYFNTSGDPCVDIEVSGPLDKRINLSCLIDTGFTGFLSIPLLQAFPIGLILHGTTTVKLADGSIQYRLTCLGQAHLDGRGKIGVIIIDAGSTQVLLGMEFVKKFNKKVIVDPLNGIVELADVVPPPSVLASPGP